MDIVGDNYLSIFHLPVVTPVSINTQCFDAVNQAVFDYCGGYNDYSIKYSRIAAHLCSFTNQDSDRIVTALKGQCA